jgi:hypothetical protein
MGERHQRPVLGEAETDDAISGAQTRRRCHRRSACVRDSRAKASNELEVFQDRNRLVKTSTFVWGKE